MNGTFLTQVIPYLVPKGISNISQKNIKNLAFLRLFLYLFLGVILLLFVSSLIHVSPVKAINPPDPTLYPYGPNGNGIPINCTFSDGTVGQCDPWGFAIKNCTSYVAYRVNLNKGYPFQQGLSGTAYPIYNGATGAGNSLGNAGNWDNAVRYASSTGSSFYVDKVPAVGAAVVWDPGSTTGGVSGIGSAGHVAYVEKVNEDGTVDISEYNYPSPLKYNYRANTKGDHYIHFNSTNDGMTGSLSGNVYHPDGTININPTLITATVKSDTDSNMDFYYIKSYLGSYRFNRLPAREGDTILLRATDGSNTTTIEDVSIFPDIPDAIYTSTTESIILDNICHYTDIGSINTYCGGIPFVESAGWGGQYVVAGATGSVSSLVAGVIIGGVEVCTSAPTTSSNVTGTTKGNNGWWRSKANISFYADAPCGSNGLKTYYSINGGSQQTYTAPFEINQEGVFNITYHSVDGKGNVESNKSVEVKIDWTPPVTTGTATGPRDTNGIFRNDVTAGLNATDNLSGVEKQQYTTDGGSNWIDRGGNNNTFVISGNGVSRFLFRSEDKAGNIEVSKDSGPIIINKYVIFSNGSNNSLRFLRSTGLNISGDIHSNGTVSFEANTGSIIGTTIETVGVNNLFATSNTNVTVPTITKGVNSVQMLSYPLSMYKSLARVVFPSSLYMNSVSSTYSGIIYVEGDVTMTDVSLSGPLSIVATGTITDITTNSTYQTGDPNNGVLLYAGKDVNVNSTGNRNLGLVYAPTGTVFVKATNLTLNGSLVGRDVEIGSTTTLNLSYNPGFSSASYTLPLSAMGLVKPTNVTTTLSSVPNLSKPTNASTGISNTKPKISWYSGVGAFGYQLQLSTSSNFSTIAFDGSYVSTVANPTLLKRTKYYWRVRSVNEAGVSNWSSVRYFTTL